MIFFKEREIYIDIFRMVAFWKKVYVPDIILHEVNHLSYERAIELGLTIIPTPLVNLPNCPSLSFQDRTCLYFVRENGWVCITNDKPLRKECVNTGAEVVWGLKMLLYLIENKQISKSRAEDVAIKIQDINPTITIDILEEFSALLKAI